MFENNRIVYYKHEVYINLDILSNIYYILNHYKIILIDLVTLYFVQVQHFKGIQKEFIIKPFQKTLQKEFKNNINLGNSFQRTIHCSSISEKFRIRNTQLQFRIFLKKEI